MFLLVPKRVLFAKTEHDIASFSGIIQVVLLRTIYSTWRKEINMWKGRIPCREWYVDEQGY